MGGTHFIGGGTILWPYLGETGTSYFIHERYLRLESYSKRDLAIFLWSEAILFGTYARSKESKIETRRRGEFLVHKGIHLETPRWLLHASGRSGEQQTIFPLGGDAVLRGGVNSEAQQWLLR